MNLSNNDNREVEFGSLNGGEDGKYNGVGLVEIPEIVRTGWLSLCNDITQQSIG